MLWPQRRVSSWDEFREIVDSVQTLATPMSIGWCFRGQADAEWSLMPSLARLLSSETPASAIELEKMAVAEFQSQAHLFLAPGMLSRTTDITGWWSLMQHHRAPTRLLDWTASAYVAAYFAVEDHWDKDGAIWLFNVKSLDDAMQAKYGETPIHSENLSSLFQAADSPSVLMLVRRMESSERMIAQQGGFSVCRQPLADHAKIIDSAFADSGSRHWLQLIIPREAKPDFLRRLRTYNIAANALFPGMDGIGRSVAELLRVAKTPA
jgi:hypothetical protein